MAEFDERTGLLAHDNRPQYSFNSSIARERKKRVKQFQCFLCGLFLILIILALMISIFFSMSMTFDDENNLNNNNSTSLNDTLNLLMLRVWPLEDDRITNETTKNSSIWEEAFTYGKKKLDKREISEKTMPSLPIDSPSFRHQRVTATSDKAIQLARIGFLQEYGMQYMQRNTSNNVDKRICPNETTNFMTNFCQNTKIFCNELDKYRSFDGSCNNLLHPDKYGKAFQPFRRSVLPDYGDGVNTPRQSKSGIPLPSARTVSLVVHRPYLKDDNKFTVMLAVWGQFLDHDITATALSTSLNGSSISCCIDLFNLHPECFPVIIDNGDPLKNENVTCMEFVRSAPSPTCCLGPREQMNQVTAFIDGSVMYGVEQPLVTELRTMKYGQLRMFLTKDNRTLLPMSKNLNDGCNREEAKEKNEYCFEAGDARSNENLHLTSMHTLWARNHNNIAKNLSKINPHWNDEKLFQETRKIIGAQMQHITYKEFLPILLGSELMTKLDLHPKKSGYFNKYNSSIDPSIANHFATAAFRFAHTIIPGLMKLLRNYTDTPEYVQMHKMLFNPFKLYEPDEMDRTVRGAMNTNIEANDPYFTNELKQHLFERDEKSNTTQKKYGLDLVSLNIQRGRDHGLPGYIHWRKHCGFEEVKNFEDLSNIVDDQSLNSMKSLYGNVQDVDLYTGALSEKPLNGSFLGPTLTCLIVDQFLRLKYGDRFWYENQNKNNGFTLKQLDEIRKISLAKIICDNSDNVTYSQPLVMISVNQENDNTLCQNIPGMNLNAWKDPLHRVEMGENRIEIKVPSKN